MKSKLKGCSDLWIIVILLAVLILVPVLALSAETYKFERMWPTIQQPWFFNWPNGIAVDARGNIYVADKGNNRIQKFSPDGALITTWGSRGDGNGQFRKPWWITIDGNGNVYVTDWSNRVQKFTEDGKFIAKWGAYGSGDGEFIWACGIVADSNGNVYVVDAGNYRIQKFSSDGAFITKWGSRGSGDGEFIWDGGLLSSSIALDKSGNVYVVDPGNYRIQKFNSDGAFITKWGTYGSGDGKFNSPRGIVVDGNGTVYVVDSNTQYYNIQKFGANGEFITKWGRFGVDDGQLNQPCGIATDATGNIYVTDEGNNRIQKFTPNGEFRAKWGSEGSGDGEFFSPGGIAVDVSGNVYVVDTDNHRIQKFTQDGNLLIKWGGSGSASGKFMSPRCVALDSSGNVYVADVNNFRIQKFTSNGVFISNWGDVWWWDLFITPSGINFDDTGNVYIAESTLNCIYKFTADGELITQIGEAGSDPGQLSGPKGVCIGPDGRVYVADTANNRIQVFSSGTTPTPDDTVDKVIIVAGGGPYTGNNLWDATEMCANYAYRTLTYQGYTKDTIYYLSADTDLDLDGNGKLDDVDADATNSTLQYAINTWAKDADNLLVYMVDHGGNGTFRMSGTELLYATELDGWLDTLQQNLPGHVTLIYDACESGSFLPCLLPPAGEERYVAASTSPGEESIFVGNGTVSFSFLFWGHMFNGENFYNSFVNAQKSVSTTYSQTCQLDANGNGIGNEKEDKDLASQLRIGNETKSAGDVPVIGTVSPAQSLSGGTSASIYADQVIDADGIARVWAVITPPGYTSGGTDAPVTDLPTLDLNSVGNNRYEATYTDFTKSGSYNIAIFAMDRKGVLSLPLQTSVNVGGADDCLPVASDLSIQVPCAEYDGIGYGFLLDFYPNPADPAGLYWKLILATLTTGTGTNCIPIASDLSMPVPCVSYNGVQYGFTLDFYPNPYDPSGLYWKMDLNTLMVK